MTEEALQQDYHNRANSLREAGCTIEINHGLPYIAVEGPSGLSWFSQESEASDFLAEVPDFLNEEDYILCLLESGGVLSG